MKISPELRSLSSAGKIEHGDFCVFGKGSIGIGWRNAKLPPGGANRVIDLKSFEAIPAEQMKGAVCNLGGGFTIDLDLDETYATTEDARLGDLIFDGKGLSILVNAGEDASAECFGLSDGTRVALDKVARCQVFPQWRIVMDSDPTKIVFERRDAVREAAVGNFPKQKLAAVS